MEPKKQMKLKNKEPLPPKPTQPAVNPVALEEELTKAREGVQAAFFVFHKIFSNKKLDRNKSNQEKDNDRKLVDDLFDAGKNLDRLNPGEGVMILASVGLQELLIARDRMNEIEYTTLLVRKELNELKEALGETKKKV